MDKPVIKKSKVIDITSAGDFSGKHGTIYKFNILFENGDKGEFTTNKNPQTKFIEGEIAEYTVEEQILQTKKGPWKKTKIDKYAEPQNRQYAHTRDPEEQKRIIRAVCLTAGNKYRFLMGIHIDSPLIPQAYADKFVDIVLEICDDHKDTSKLITAQAALKEVINAIEYTPEDKRDYWLPIDGKFKERVLMFYNYIRNNE